MTKLYRKHLPAFNHAESAPEIVLLHGWGSDSSVWSAWLSYLRRSANITLLDLPGFGESQSVAWRDGDDLVALIAEQLPENAIVIGWSLGGMLAAAIAAEYSHKVQALVTIASNARFVASEDWPTAMQQPLFDRFYKLVAADFAKGCQRFIGLQTQGDAKQRDLMKQIRSEPEVSHCPVGLMRSLDLLLALDVRDALSKLNIPVLHLLGENDQLVPVAAAKHLANLSNAEVIVLNEAAHMPFLSFPEKTWDAVLGFLRKHNLCKETPSTRSLNKQLVAQSFGRAARSYDQFADLQEQVGQQMLAECRSLQVANHEQTTLLDLGCGSGRLTQQLAQQYANSSLFALDLSPGMLDFARSHYPHSSVRWFAGDAENLPVTDASISLAFSSLAVQWCENLAAVFIELERTLKPGGSAVMSTFGPETLQELRAAWQAVDSSVHVNQFLPKPAVTQAIAKTDLEVVAWHDNNRQRNYSGLAELTTELKGLGAHNVNVGRPSGLTGRNRLKQLKAAFEANADSGGNIPVSYQVWIIVLQKRESSQ